MYRAHDAELDREVALKVLRGEGDTELAARFREEARIVARLEHPGIVPVHDAGRLPDGRSFYAMTLVRGERLDAHLTGLSTLGERLRLFQRIAEPVAFAHDRGVIHRDLKPANIMVGPFGEVLVMDWGMAKVAGALPEPGMVLGTAGFMAPEQEIGDSGSVDHRADVFALGAILRAMIVGPGSVPRPLAAIMDRAMAQSPDQRYSSVTALAADVGRFLDGEPVEAYPEPVWERLRRLALRHRTPLVLVLAYLVMRLLLLLLAGR